MKTLCLPYCVRNLTYFNAIRVHAYRLVQTGKAIRNELILRVTWAAKMHEWPNRRYTLSLGPL